MYMHPSCKPNTYILMHALSQAHKQQQYSVTVDSEVAHAQSGVHVTYTVREFHICQSCGEPVIASRNAFITLFVRDATGSPYIQ